MEKVRLMLLLEQDFCELGLENVVVNYYIEKCDL